MATNNTDTTTNSMKQDRDPNYNQKIKKYNHSPKVEFYELIASIFEVLDRRTHVVSVVREDIVRVDRTIELKGVHFSYPVGFFGWRERDRERDKIDL